MHWAAALPRAVDPDSTGDTPSESASQNFRRLAQELRWSEMAAASGLEAALPIPAPRQGSVWESVVMRVGREKSPDPRVLGERSVLHFATEAARLKCWRRDQKVEHREIMEGIAAGLAMHMLSLLGGAVAPWEGAGR